MKHSIDCLPCLMQQAVKLAKNHLHSEDEQRLLLKTITNMLACMDADVSAPYIAHKMQRALKEALHNPDPYQKDKAYYNREMLKIEQEMIQLRDRDEDSFVAGIKLAAAGNIIDFGPGYGLSRQKVLSSIKETMDKDFCRDTMGSLQNTLEKARSLLYLGDNAGEIVFDKIFIAGLKETYPSLEITFATRGEPVLNDITEEDAYLVGMDKLARIINNGTDIPGTVLSCCSADFLQCFAEADVILAKGQGNFESLFGSGRANLYYLFLCKCSLFMERLGAGQNDIMLIREQPL